MFSITQNGISGSLQCLSTGEAYLISGDNVLITTGSNGQVTIAVTITNVNFTSSSLGFYSAEPIEQQNRIGQLSSMNNLANVAATSADVQLNFSTVASKIAELITKVNTLEAALSEEAGGIGITE